jgi:hypothetical protein
MMMKEMDIAGVFITPVLGWALLALLVSWILARLLGRFGVYHWVWHRHLFDLCLYVAVFATITFFVSGT